MKSEELFGKRVSSKDGLRSYCNECRRLESKLYRQNNKDKRRETVRKFLISRIIKTNITLRG